MRGELLRCRHAADAAIRCRHYAATRAMLRYDIFTIRYAAFAAATALMMPPLRYASLFYAAKQWSNTRRFDV